MKAPNLTVPRRFAPFTTAVQKRWRWILFGIFLVEITLLLAVGIYHLALDSSILYAALIIFSCAYIISAARTVLSKKGIAAGGKTLKSTATQVLVGC